MQVLSPQEQWDCQRKEVELHRLRCWGGDTELRFSDGEIVLRSFDRVCTARIVWDHGYGERALERGPYSSVHAQIGRILRNGPTFGPVHAVDDEELRFVQFENDQSFRATRPHGEVRVKRFLDQHVLLFVPDGGVRLLHVSKDPDELMLAAEVYGPEWASCLGPRLAVRFEGRTRELHVSNNKSELAYHEIDLHTRLSLRPHSLPDGDRPAQAALYLFRTRGEARLLALVPIDATSEESLIYSDERAVLSAPSQERGGSTAGTSGRSPASASARPAGGEPVGASAIPAGLLALVVRYLCEVAGRTGGGPEMRAQSEMLLRAVERGVNVSGWGAQLRSALERACDYKFSGSARGFCYLIKALKDDGILARPWGRKCQLVFAELHCPDSLAIALLCERFGVTPESLLGTPSPVETSQTGRASAPPTGRPPPTTPPPRAPTPAARDHGVRVPPTVPTPVAPFASEPTRDAAPQASSADGPEAPTVPPPSPPAEPASTPTAPRPPTTSPFMPEIGTRGEGFFAAIEQMLRADASGPGVASPNGPPRISVPLVPPVAAAPAAPPDEDFMREEFMFLDRRILRSATEQTDEEMGLNDPDGQPRGPPAGE